MNVDDLDREAMTRAEMTHGPDEETGAREWVREAIATTLILELQPQDAHGVEHARSMFLLASAAARWPLVPVEGWYGSTPRLCW